MINTARLSVDSSTPPILSGTITVVGVSGKNTDAMSLAFYLTSNGVSLPCNSSGLTPPASSSANEAC